jgi:hypothetical protein
MYSMLSITDAIIEGGSFYTMQSLEKSFKVGLRELFYGNKDSNTAHLSSEAAFHGLLTYFHKILNTIYPGFTAQAPSRQKRCKPLSLFSQVYP